MRPTLLLAAICATFAGLAAAEPTRPNVLFLIADDWGRGHAGAYGCTWVKTPNFDRVAKEGLLFLNAYTPTAKCTPSRSTILTGRHPWLLGAAANHQCVFPPEHAIFPDVLEQNGYAYATTGKVWGPGLALKADGSPRAMAGKQFMQKKAEPPTTGITKNDYSGNFEAFLSQAKPGQPWFFWLGSIEPHREYEQGTGARLGGKKTTDIDRVPAYWPDNETIRGDLLDYAFEVEHFDRHVGRALAMLEKTGQLENTIVVVTSDNGMPFPRVKGSAYENANHLPLAIRWPKGIKNPGRKVTDYVSFVDFAPTFLDAAGITWPQAGALATTSGRSLSDIFQSGVDGRSNPARDHTLIGRERNDFGRPGDLGYPIRGIVKDGLAYLENSEPTRWPACNPETGYLDTDASPTKSFILHARREKGSDPFWELCFGMRPGQELYDLRTDSDCVKNLAASRTVDVEKLRTQMWAELKAAGDLRAIGRGAEYEAHPSADKKKIGFYERYMRGELIDVNWVKKDDFEKAPLKPAR
jgi:arylsulfatase A-like enzyme